MSQRDWFGARALTAARSFISRAISPPAPIGGGGGWMRLFSPHEPFSGAWQRNIEECSTTSLLAFSGVFACVSIISSDIAKIPVRIMRRDPEGGRVEVPNHPAAILLNRPNSYQTRVDFLQQYMATCLFAGNAYAFKERDSRGVVSALHWIDPYLTFPLVGDDGSIFYKVSDRRFAAFFGDGGSVNIPQREVLHHRAFTLSNPLVGVTPLYAAGASAAVGASITMSSQRFFGNSSRPSGVLTAPGKISKETAARLKEEWEQNFSGRNQGRAAVLGEGLDWKPLTMSAADAQLIEQLRWSVEDVARCFRVPSFLLGDMTKATYRNSEQLMRLYYSGCLQFHIEALEARLDRELDLKAGNETDFDLDSLLRTDSDTRMDTYQKAIASGVFTINDARRREDMKPVPGGDQPFIQSQYVPLHAAANGEPDPALPPAPAPAPDPDDDDDEPDDMTDEERQAIALAIVGAA